LGIGDEFFSQESPKKFQLPQATPEALLFFFGADREKGNKILQKARTRLCPTNEFLQSPAKSAFKRLILETPLYQHLLLTMSSIPELTDQECEKGQLTQRPPIPYATPKAETILKASRETVKVKTSEGEVKMAVLGDNPGPEEYLQHLNSFTRMLSRKKLDEEMTKLTKAVLATTARARKLARTPSDETEPQTSVRLGLWEAAEVEIKKAEAEEAVKAGLVYDLFRKTLKEDPELQWDRIVDDMHSKDPWEDLRGYKYNGLRRKSVASLWDCIDFHKLTVYSVDAAERQRFYMLCNLKKPAKSSIRSHVTRMETLNKYLGLLPTIKNSPQAVASTELGNVPFNETTLASIVLSHLPVAWRTQYALTHALVPESPRAILVDLENIEKLFAEKANEAARANKAKVASALKGAVDHVPRKGKRSNGGGPDKGTPKKGRTDKFCKWCKAVDGPFTTHNTTECRRFNKDGSQKDRPTKPFDSTKKPWKKPGSGNTDQISHLTEEMDKLKKRLKKSQKRGKKRARYSSDSDSDSD
jgi:hypothetical protein